MNSQLETKRFCKDCISKKEKSPEKYKLKMYCKFFYKTASGKTIF